VSRLWVDANVILRFLTKDPPEMAELSARLTARVERGEVALYMWPLVLAEVIWVLKSFYRYSMPAIAHIVIALVSASGIEVDNRQLIIRVVELARDRNMDFADAHLALQAAERGERVCTFDESDFRLLLVEWMAPE
jgi:predicted nucleic acid-binding protein